MLDTIQSRMLSLESEEKDVSIRIKMVQQALDSIVCRTSEVSDQICLREREKMLLFENYEVGQGSSMTEFNMLVSELTNQVDAASMEKDQLWEEQKKLNSEVWALLKRSCNLELEEEELKKERSRLMRKIDADSFSFCGEFFFGGY